jgi:hypothetical protein
MASFCPAQAGRSEAFLFSQHKVLVAKMYNQLGELVQKLTVVVFGPSLNIAVVLGLIASIITIIGLFRGLYIGNYLEIGRKTLVVVGALTFPALALWLTIAVNLKTDYLNVFLYAFAMLYVAYAAVCLVIINIILWKSDYTIRDYTALTTLTMATYIYGLFIFSVTGQAAPIMSILFLIALFIHVCLTAFKFIIRYFWPLNIKAKKKNTEWSNLGFDSLHFMITAALAIYQAIFMNPEYIQKLGYLLNK